MSNAEDSIRQKLKDKRQEQTKELQGRRQKYTAAIKRAFASADGKILLHYLMSECGYQRNSVQGNSKSGEFLENNTMYNEGRRDLYLGLRSMVRPDTLSAVEIYGVIKDLQDDTYDDMFE